MLSTKNSLIGRIANQIGINALFHKYETIDFDNTEDIIISPVEAKVAHIGKINQEGIIISKKNRKVNLNDLIGNYALQFSGGIYINFYLSPLDKHFWITPGEGHFIYTQKNEGKFWLPVFIGLENILGIEVFDRAVKRNASIGSIFQTNNFNIAMIAVGSLNVNGIHTDYEEMKNYHRGIPCGYFTIGSSMIFCFPNYLDVLIEEGSVVKMGQKILK